jgi:hypothetical protein
MWIFGFHIICCLKLIPFRKHQLEKQEFIFWNRLGFTLIIIYNRKYVFCFPNRANGLI